MHHKTAVKLGVVIALVGAMLTPATTAYGQQISQHVRKLGYTHQYEFAWRDYKNQIQQIKFNFNRDDVQQALAEFRPFSDDEANNYIYNVLKSQSVKPRRDGIRIDVANTGNGISLTAMGHVRHESDLERGLDDMRSLMQQSREEYVHQSLFRFVDDNVIMPDHKRITQMYVNRMRPLALAIAREAGYDKRRVLNYALGFMQTIPYDELLRRDTSNGAGFATPIEIFERNRGDCDSKSVALLSMMRALYPNMRMMMVYIPQHTFVAFEVPYDTQDVALRIGNRNFVLAEPVGPRILPLGQVDDKSLAALQSGDFTYEEIPLR